jgi:glycosyltransferase involved in cell wall biosynthesis
MKLFIIPSWYPTKLYPKSGTFFRERANILHKSGNSVHIINAIIHSLRNIIYLSNISKKPIEFIDDFGISTLQIEAINQAPKYENGAFKQQHKIWNQIFQDAINRYGPPDGVLIYSTIWAGVSLTETLKEMKIPFGISEHLKEFLLPNGFTKKQKNEIHRCYSQASFIAATSSPLLQKMKYQFPEVEDKMTIIPNPVDTDLFKPNPAISKNSKSPFHFIACGLFRAEKEFLFLLDSFHVLSKKYDCILTLVGDGTQESQLRKKVKQLNLENRVSFPGYLQPEALVKKMGEAHALVLSSSVETFGMVVIEAMACGLPVVATKCGGPEFTLQKDTGILVKSNEVESLAAGMEKMMNKYLMFNRNEIRETAVKRFSTKAYAETIQQLFSPD